MAQYVIEVKGISKIYNKEVVLDSVSCQFEKGKTYGIVGRNGSGKTLLLKSICGFIIPDSGYVIVDGKKVGTDVDIPEGIGAIIETPGFIMSYSGMRNLRILATIKGEISKKEIRDVMELVGLDPQSRKPVGKYSLGMRQKLGIAQAIMENPDILILDEPMNGLDNESVTKMREVLKKLSEAGTTILLASHNQEDINSLCDEVIYMDHGRIIGEKEQ